MEKAHMTDRPTTDDANTVAIARQPVFDAKRRLWGYALFCVGPAARQAPPGQDTADNVALQLAAGAYMGLEQLLEGTRKILVRFSERNILDQLPYALPAPLTVVAVEEAVFGEAAVHPALNQLKADGYLLAVTNYTAADQWDSFYRMADIFSIDVRHRSRGPLAELVAEAGAHGATLMAMQVEDFARFDLCTELGFALFHGPFFKTPETVTVRKLASNEVSRFALMRAIEQEEVDFEQLAETIQADAALSFRLLAYLNSAAFGLRQKIKSIQQAISLLGWRKMKNWLRVVLLNDLNRSPHAPDLMLLAAQRGKFLERIGHACDFWGFDPENLHMLGIFSLLDAMLGMPMTAVVTHLPLDEKVKGALRGEANNEYQPLLELARCFEESRWPDAETLLQRLNMDSPTIHRAFREAVEWAAAFTDS
jgi:c-di-GMP phosphodiesterase